MSHPYPHFLIVGFMKSATTSVFDHILDHPSVQAPLRKELHYFTRELDPFYPDSLYGLEYGEQLRYQKGSEKLCGEASPSYIVAANRIAAFNPNTKIIILLRDPVERALSQYRQYAQFEMLPSDLESTEIDALNFVQDSVYEPHVHSFLEHFHGSNVMLVSFEAFCSTPREAMKHIFRFLGLPPLAIANPYSLSRTPSMEEPAFLRERLQTYFASRRGKITSLINQFRPVTYPASIEAFESY